MAPFDLALHALNFAAPALVLAVLMSLFNLILGLKKQKNRSYVPMNWQQFVINFVVGVLLFNVGLWWFGRDGMMATYAALVLGVGTCQWVMVG